jgi:hypothetical protein
VEIARAEWEAMYPPGPDNKDPFVFDSEDYGFLTKNLSTYFLSRRKVMQARRAVARPVGQADMTNYDAAGQQALNAVQRMKNVGAAAGGGRGAQGDRAGMSVA